MGGFYPRGIFGGILSAGGFYPPSNFLRGIFSGHVLQGLNLLPFCIRRLIKFFLYLVLGFGCHITRELPADPSLYNLQTGLWLECVVAAHGQQREIHSNPTSVPFYPAAVADRYHVIFSCHHLRQDIILRGLPSLLATYVVRFYLFFRKIIKISFEYLTICLFLSLILL